MARWKQIVSALATLAVAFGMALVLNCGILGFFGQKSADRAEHSLVGLGNRANIGQAVGISFAALVPCYLRTVFPDLDIQLLGMEWA